MKPATRRLTVALLLGSLLTIAAPARAAGPGLSAEVRTSVSVARVGGTIRYAVAVENTTAQTIQSVTIRDFVDENLDVVAVPILDRVAAAGLSSLGRAEEIFWIVKKLRPGERVRVSWKGRVTEAGDGRLENRITAEGSDGSTLEVTTVTYVLRTRCLFGRSGTATVT